MNRPDPQRWLYHVLREEDLVAGDYAPASLTNEGFVHASYRPLVLESARLYFAKDVTLRVLQIDPRELVNVRIEIAATPRGSMPHIHGMIPRRAIARILTLEEIETAPDVLS